MAGIIDRNVPDLSYSMQALTFFRSEIILNKLNIYQNILFIKYEKDLKIVNKLCAIYSL